MEINLKEEIYNKKLNDPRKRIIERALNYFFNTNKDLYKTIDRIWVEFCREFNIVYCPDSSPYQLDDSLIKIKSIEEVLQLFYIRCAILKIEIKEPRDTTNYGQDYNIEADLFKRNWKCMNCGQNVNTCIKYKQHYICQTCNKEIFVSIEHNPVYAFRWKDLMKKNNIYVFYDYSYCRFNTIDVDTSGYFCYGIEIKKE